MSTTRQIPGSITIFAAACREVKAPRSPLAVHEAGLMDADAFRLPARLRRRQGPKGSWPKPRQRSAAALEPRRAAALAERGARACRGWKARLETESGRRRGLRSPRSSAAALIEARAARRDFGIGHGLLPPIWVTAPALWWCAFNERSGNAERGPDRSRRWWRGPRPRQVTCVVARRARKSEPVTAAIEWADGGHQTANRRRHRGGDRRSPSHDTSKARACPAAGTQGSFRDIRSMSDN